MLYTSQEGQTFWISLIANILMVWYIWQYPAMSLIILLDLLTTDNLKKKKINRDCGSSFQLRYTKHNNKAFWGRRMHRQTCISGVLQEFFSDPDGRNVKMLIYQDAVNTFFTPLKLNRMFSTWQNSLKTEEYLRAHSGVAIKRKWD